MPSTASAMPAWAANTDHLVEHQHHHVESLDRELLLAEERAVEVMLERLYPEQPVEDVPPLVGGKGLGVGTRLDRLAQPEPLAMAREVSIWYAIGPA